MGISRGSKLAARLSCRVDPDIKQRAEEAAALMGQSITDFTEAALAEKAEGVFERFERIRLSARDFERFISIVSIVGTPKPPTLELKSAMKDYERQRDAEPGGDW